jgi:hypothetical protein
MVEDFSEAMDQKKIENKGGTFNRLIFLAGRERN